MKPITIYRRIVRSVKKYNPRFDDALFEQAFFYAKKKHRGVKWQNGDPYLCFPLKACYRLAHLKVDDETLLACLLHDALKSDHSDEDYILETFGEDVLSLIKGVIKIDEIKYLLDMEEKQIDALRKMFLSFSSDIRVVLTKMAKRLVRLEDYVDEVDENEIVRLARETIGVYVPIIDGLGVWDIKWRLEDLSFKYLKPEKYSGLSSEITESKSKMESYIRRVSHIIEKNLNQEGVKNFSINGRVKNLYSIHKKIVYKNKSLDEIYDIVAIRILVEDLTDCYRVLGIIHNVWRPLAHRIKDYIAVPKMNGYRSLHTTIFCLDNHLTEIQIRTYEMNEEAEYGMAAHMTYGQNKISLVPTDDQKHWISSLKDFRFTDVLLDDDDDYKQKLKVDVFSNHIFVFTPKGHVKDLPRGASAIDFAYAIHTDMGHQLVGAKVNGKMVSLDTPLSNGDIVEIIVRSDSAGPKREWLSLVKTSKAKNKIKVFLRKTEKTENLKIGRELLQKELQKMRKKLTAEDKKLLCSLLPYSDVEDLYAAIGEGSVSTSLVIKKLYPGERSVEQKRSSSNTGLNLKVHVDGIGDTNTRIAKCCNPKTGEKIKGYVTIGHGVSVHSSKCKFIQRVDKSRIVDATWR